MVGIRGIGFTRAATAAALCMSAVALWAGDAAGASRFRIVSMRAAQAGATPPVRFVGSIRVHVPAAWHEIAQREPNEPTFSVTLSSDCSAKLYLAPLSAVTRRSAKHQLDSLRRGSQPGVPVPGPVRVPAQGALPHGRAGWWRIVAPVGSEGFALYGGAVASLGGGRWVKVLAGLAREPTCPLPLPGEASAVEGLSAILTSLDPTSVRVVRSH